MIKKRLDKQSTGLIVASCNYDVVGRILCGKSELPNSINVLGKKLFPQSTVNFFTVKLLDIFMNQLDLKPFLTLNATNFQFYENTNMFHSSQVKAVSQLDGLIKCWNKISYHFNGYLLFPPSYAVSFCFP